MIQLYDQEDNRWGRRHWLDGKACPIQYIHMFAHTPKKKKKGAELKGAMPLSNQQKFCFTLQSLYVGPSKDLSPDHQYISIKHG